MKQNRKIQTFNDGVCNICKIDEDGNAGEKVVSLRFEDRTVGTKRYYEAMTNKIQIDRLIRVPFQSWLAAEEYLVALNDQVFELIQVQMIPDTSPRTNDLSLRFTRQRRITDAAI